MKTWTPKFKPFNHSKIKILACKSNKYRTCILKTTKHVKEIKEYINKWRAIYYSWTGT